MQQSEMKVFDMNIKEIFCDSEFNCRGKIMPIDVLDLVRSIESTGLKQPIVIQPYTKVPGKKYRIVAGHRRYTAFIVLERDTIPAVIEENLSELDARKLNLEENLKRKDLNLLQIAKAIQPFLHAGWTQQEVAQQLGQPAHWVQVCVSLLKLPDDIQQEAAAGYLTQEHIKQLATLNKTSKKDAMYEAVRKIKNAKLLGERKKITVVKKVTKPYSKAVRTRQEMFDLMAKIQDTVGNSFVTRVLAWCTGEITEFDLHRDFKEFCNSQGVKYDLPTDLVEAAFGVVS